MQHEPSILAGVNLTAYLNDCCMVISGYVVRKQTLYNHYLGWITQQLDNQQSGHTPSSSHYLVQLDRSAFDTAMRDCGYRSGRRFWKTYWIDLVILPGMNAPPPSLN